MSILNRKRDCELWYDVQTMWEFGGLLEKGIIGVMFVLAIGFVLYLFGVV